MVSSTLALPRYSIIYVNMKQGSALRVKSSPKQRIGGKVSHSLTPLAPFCCTPFCSAVLRSTPLGGLFVSEKVAMY